MSILCRFASHRDAVNAGWFSRRHETPDAHYEAQARWNAEREAKRVRDLAQHAAAEEAKRLRKAG